MEDEVEGGVGGERSSFVISLIENRAKEGALLVKSLAAKEPSALGLDTYYKQYYLCLAAAAATIKWIEAEKGVIVTNHSLMCSELGDN
ncbi:hypothetical protein C5167_032935 [Papaver somniferum]|uniref:Uncharacterized protein n=1 Tax=Papaver somniferum TaxID=3469 RepID=A0A4Y7KCC7_PAPSO|nr:hypothetical protein C5167_032935 [Papaver somniferum]